MLSAVSLLLPTPTPTKKIRILRLSLLLLLLIVLVLLVQQTQQQQQQQPQEQSDSSTDNDDLFEQWKEEEEEEEEMDIPITTTVIEENLEFHELIRQHRQQQQQQQQHFTQQSDIEPPLRIGETMKHRHSIDRILKEQYKQFNPYQRTNKGIEYTYGELTSLGVRQLLQLLFPQEEIIKKKKVEKNKKELDDPLPTPSSSSSSSSNIILYDLGSGIGKFVVQTVLENYTNLKEIIGIELSLKRHEMAVTAWETIQQQQQQQQQQQHLVSSTITSETKSSTTSSTSASTTTTTTQQQRVQVQQQPNVTFIHGNIIEQNFTNATHLYISSLCFPEDVIETLSQQIIHNANKYSNIVSIATLSDLRLLEEQQEEEQDQQQQPSQQWIKTRHGIQMTWGQGEVRLYTRRRRHFHSTVGTKDEKEEERT